MRFSMKYDYSELVDAIQHILRALRQVVNSLSAWIQVKYEMIFDEYLALNHMERVGANNFLLKHLYFILHRSILKLLAALRS